MKLRLLAAAALLAFAAPAQASTYNAFADFSIAGNPNGPWRYGFGTPAVSFTALVDTTPQFVSGQATPAWFSLLGDFFTPLVMANNTGGVLAFGTVTLPADTLLLHPGNRDDLAAIVQFVAPVAGVYDYTLLFSNADSGRVRVSADLNGTDFFAPVSLSGLGVSGTGSLTLAVGDVVSFNVDRAGDFFNDSTAFNAILSLRSDPPPPPPPPTGVPAPAGFAVLALGVAVLGTLRRRAA